MSGGFDDARIVGEPFVERSGVRVPQDVGTEYLGGLNDPVKAPVDDASVVEAAGQPVYLCEGSYENIKITTPVDMLTAEALLAQRQRTSATAGE